MFGHKISATSLQVTALYRMVSQGSVANRRDEFANTPHLKAEQPASNPQPVACFCYGSARRDDDDDDDGDDDDLLLLNLGFEVNC